jgi:hypothetical protein
MLSLSPYGDYLLLTFSLCQPPFRCCRRYAIIDASPRFSSLPMPIFSPIRH